MSNRKRTSVMPRREFLRTAGIVGGAAAVTLTAKPAKSADPAQGEGRKSGYRETEHIRKYYELARF